MMKLFVLPLLAAVSFGLELRRDTSDAESAVATWMAATRADEEFLAGTWHQLTVELAQLKAATSPTNQSKGAKKTTSGKVGTAEVAKAVAATRALKGKAMLAPMEGMLKGLYEDQKDRISQANKREAASKDRFLEQERKHNATLAHWKDRLDHHHMTKAKYDDFVRVEDRQFKYWQGVRQRQHSQFHMQLKMMHGLMAKEKGMIKAYDTALSEKTATKAGAQQATAIAQAVAPEAPEITLLQTRTAEFNMFVSNALLAARRELDGLDTVK